MTIEGGCVGNAKGSPIGSVDYPSRPDITLQYEGLSRVTSMVDGLGTSLYTYNIVGALLSEDGPWDNDTLRECAKTSTAS